MTPEPNPTRGPINANVKTLAGSVVVTKQLLDGWVDLQAIIEHAMWCRGCPDCDAARERMRVAELARQRLEARWQHRLKTYVASRLVDAAERLGYEREVSDW